MQLVVGIDPGFDGAFVVIDAETKRLVVVYEMPIYVVEKKKTRKVRKNEKFAGIRKTKSYVAHERNINVEELVRLAQRWDAKHTTAYLERVHARPMEGVTSSFRFGESFGIVKGVLTALGIPITLVEPSRWTKEMHGGLSRDMEAKDRSVVAARRLFPEVNFVVEGSRQVHAGLVDASLIGMYGCLDTRGELHGERGNRDERDGED